MNAIATAWAWSQGGHVHERVILLALAQYVDEDFQCHPSVETLAKVAILGERTVYRTLASLKVQGLVQQIERGGSHGRANVYRLVVDKEFIEAHREKSPERPKNEERSEGFEVFWTHYPRRVGKPAALRAFRSVNGAEALADILKDLETRFQETEKKFIPYPATYLNQRRWEDEPAVPTLKKSPLKVYWDEF